MTRTCSKCGNKGHNSRTCRSTTQCYWMQQMNKPFERRYRNNSLRLFGVQLDQHDLSSSPSSSLFATSTKVIKRQRWRKDYYNSLASSSPHFISFLSGYQANKCTNRHDQISRADNGGLQETNCNKGKEWSLEEHWKFLEGIEKLGKGDWRGISRHYVTTRSPTQISSHAQNYFLRLQNNITSTTATINNLDLSFNLHKKRRRGRPPLFDVAEDKLVSPRQQIGIIANDPNTEVFVNNPYECWPAVHNSRPLLIDTNLKNVSSSSQSGAAEGEGLDLELKLATG